MVYRNHRKIPKDLQVSTDPYQHQMEQHQLAYQKQYLNQNIRGTKVVYATEAQTGQEPTKKHENKMALPPGKRVSKSGKIYYERRRNRSTPITTEQQEQASEQTSEQSSSNSAFDVDTNAWSGLE